MASKSIKNSTIGLYEHQYNKYIKNSPISNIKFSEMNKDKAQKYINAIAKTHIKVSYLKQIKLFFSTAFKSVKLQTKDRLLSDEEISLILNNCKDELLLTVIKVALSTGMIIVEILALTEKTLILKSALLTLIRLATTQKIIKTAIEKLK